MLNIQLFSKFSFCFYFIVHYISYLIQLIGFEFDNNIRDSVSNKCFHLHEILNSRNLWDFTCKRPSPQHLHITRQFGEAGMNGCSFGIMNPTFSIFSPLWTFDCNGWYFCFACISVAKPCFKAAVWIKLS